jgi:multidrug efflux pump
MNISAPFIARPVATTLLTFGLSLAGIVAFNLLPVSPLPQVDFPTISVTAALPGASPETVATSLTTPLERHLGAIADVTEMTSTSSVGSARITLQFGLNRNIDGAARDVQAAINAARADLPSDLRSNPQYRKVNPAEQPLLILSLTSDTLDAGQLYDSAATVMQQRLAQVQGVGDVQIGGSSLPAVRVELNPRALFKYGIGLEDVRAALSAANANAPKGAVEEGERRFQIYTNDSAREAKAYRSLVIAYRNNAAVRLGDVGEVVDSVENIRNLGLTNGRPSVLIQVLRQPAANIIETADRVLAILPQVQDSLPPDLKVSIVVDRTKTIRASLREVERTLVIATVLVILVVFVFLRNVRAAVIPSVAVPVSLLGTFGAMYLLGFSLNNLSLMALTISTGFVVDDAIVLLENISRHVERGMPRLEAALLGAREVGFTVLAMSLSLIAVFIPILLMGGIVGRLFREFAVSLSIAILVSLAVSLTTTPMMCARLLRPAEERKASRLALAAEHWFEDVRHGYARSLAWVLRHGLLIMGVLLATVCLNVYLYVTIPKGFFPDEDTGRIQGGLRGDQSISFQSMRDKLAKFVDIVKADPAVDAVAGFTGGGQTNGGMVFVSLKPKRERGMTSDDAVNRLRPKLLIPGAIMFLTVPREIRIGGRFANATYQYTLQGDDVTEVRAWTLKLVRALEDVDEVVDVNSDQDVKGLETRLVIDRAAAARLGLTMSQISSTLYDAFGQRQVSTIYNPMNQYRVVMEVSPEFWQSPETLRDIYVSTSGGAISSTTATNAVAATVSVPSPGAGQGAAAADPNAPAGEAAQIAADAARNLALNALTTTGRAVSAGAAVSTRVARMVPLAEVAHYETGETPLAVNHQGAFVAATVSFNLPEGVSLSDAVAAINRTVNRIGMPSSIQGSFQGMARTFQDSLSSQPALILGALIAVYIVLGVLYESYIHPITILSTLPSAGVGAVAALMLARMDFTIIALIGVILLIGIVKKNAIMMIDFALDAERQDGLSPRDAIFKAAVLRFRPIMMTTMAAMLGALPLALGGGEGTELRRPLGIAVVGGLLVSQVLTLYSTPVVYLYMDRFGRWLRAVWAGLTGQSGAEARA